jgi:DNA polymerase-1
MEKILTKKKTETAPLVLIDADIWLYRACDGAIEEIVWDDDGIVSVYCDLNAAKRTIDELIKVYQDLGELVFCLSEGETFRKKVFESYKSNRAGKRKPVGLKQLKDWLKIEFNTKFVSGLEGDDVIGILATKAKDREVIMVSDDKDLNTVPGRLLRLGQDTTNSVGSSWWYTYYQALTGDITDGYPGLKGCGPKGAEKLLGAREKASDDFEAIGWPIVERAFCDAGLATDDAIAMVRCAKILTSNLWNGKEPVLWVPPVTA